MKVRILSGNARGQVIEMGQTEAEVNIATGFAEAVVEMTPVKEEVLVGKKASPKPPTE